MASFQLSRKMAACLRDDLDPPFHQPLPLPISLENVECSVFGHAVDAVDSLDDVGEARMCE
jgi:hypothetical protein